MVGISERNKKAQVKWYLLWELLFLMTACFAT